VLRVSGSPAAVGRERTVLLILAFIRCQTVNNTRPSAVHPDKYQSLVSTWLLAAATVRTLRVCTMFIPLCRWWKLDFRESTSSSNYGSRSRDCWQKVLFRGAPTVSEYNPHACTLCTAVLCDPPLRSELGNCRASPAARLELLSGHDILGCHGCGLQVSLKCCIQQEGHSQTGPVQPHWHSLCMALPPKLPWQVPAI